MKRDDQEFPDIGFALLPAFEKRAIPLKPVENTLTKSYCKKEGQKLSALQFQKMNVQLDFLQNLASSSTIILMEDNKKVSIYALTI